MLQPAQTEIAQVAVIVDDLDRALDGYCRVFGCPRPPVQETAGADETGVRYRGVATGARAKLAFLRFRNITLELIEPLGEPSVWRDALDERGTCGHHIAFRVQGMQGAVDELGRRGAPLVQQGEFRGGRYAYLETRGELGLDLELLEND